MAKLTFKQIKERLRKDVTDFDIGNGSLRKLISELHIKSEGYYSSRNTLTSPVFSYYSTSAYKIIKDKVERVMAYRRECKCRFVD